MSGTPANKPTPPAKSTPASAKEHSTLTDILGKKSSEDIKKAPEHVHYADKKDDEKVVLPVGPEGDKEENIVRVDEKSDVDQEPNFDRDEDYDENKDSDIFLSPEVVSLRTNKTPAELAAESPAETAKRYGIDTTISDEDADNPRIQVYRDTLVNQVPSGTHLHPDIAKDLMNRGIAEQSTDNAQVKRVVTEVYDFAPDAEHNDKF